MLFFYPRYGKRLIFRAMQAMQFIRVYEHTEKHYLSAVRYAVLCA